MKALGIILAGGNNYRMRELSEKRAIAAMPVGGGFRAIDFALSNMSNSHIQRVAVLTQYNSRSLNEHLNSSNGGISDVSRVACIFLHRRLRQRTETGTAEQRMPWHRTLIF